jgi:hypothetical protein
MSNLLQILGILGTAVSIVVGATAVAKGIVAHARRRLAEGRNQWICSWIRSEEGTLHLDAAFDGIIERRRIRKQQYRKENGEGNGTT